MCYLEQLHSDDTTVLYRLEYMAPTPLRIYQYAYILYYSVVRYSYSSKTRFSAQGGNYFVGVLLLYMCVARADIL